MSRFLVNVDAVLSEDGEEIHAQLWLNIYVSYSTFPEESIHSLITVVRQSRIVKLEMQTHGKRQFDSLSSKKRTLISFLYNKAKRDNAEIHCYKNKLTLEMFGIAGGE